METKRDKLNPKILDKLIRKSGLKPRSIRSILSRLKNKYKVTLNAAAYIFAKRKGFSVARYLNERDWESLRNVEFKKISIKTRSLKKKHIKEIVKYETSNKFLKAHILEINKTYTFGCYTACFVLMRKVLENLIVEMLRKKYPEKKKEHREKYYDFNRNRNHDFNILLKNLRESSKDFESERKLVERICQLASIFKESANEMAHSLYHIATKREIDESNFQNILDLIKEVFRKHFNEKE